MLLLSLDQNGVVEAHAAPFEIDVRRGRVRAADEANQDSVMERLDVAGVPSDRVLASCVNS